MTGQQGDEKAVALLHSGHDPEVYKALVRQHGLRVVYTVHTDAPAVLAALIAVQHALEHTADVVVIPHLDALESGSPWWVVTEVAGLYTRGHEYPLWSVFSSAFGRQP
ncbi:hypothetical protein AB0H42_28950 [Nocardia sp. NPDC050799]|uniref:hypothetical protein n=1 Tax=Nocardia sp. NPDC050799 TaxID=3154842 RepID=UPI00340F7BB7